MTLYTVNKTLFDTITLIIKSKNRVPAQPASLPAYQPASQASVPPTLNLEKSKASQVRRHFAIATFRNDPFFDTILTRQKSTIGQCLLDFLKSFFGIFARGISEPHFEVPENK